MKAICTGVGFGSGTETTIVRKIDVFGGNIQESQLERIASNQEVYSCEERLCLPNAGGGGDFATQLMCGTSLKKQGCFNHRVVTTVVDKLKRPWL